MATSGSGPLGSGGFPADRSVGINSGSGERLSPQEKRINRHAQKVFQAEVALNSFGENKKKLVHQIGKYSKLKSGEERADSSKPKWMQVPFLRKIQSGWRGVVGKNKKAQANLKKLEQTVIDSARNVIATQLDLLPPSSFSKLTLDERNVVLQMFTKINAFIFRNSRLFPVDTPEQQAANRQQLKPLLLAWIRYKSAITRKEVVNALANMPISSTMAQALGGRKVAGGGCQFDANVVESLYIESSVEQLPNHPEVLPLQKEHDQITSHVHRLEVSMIKIQQEIDDPTKDVQAKNELQQELVHLKKTHNQLLEQRQSLGEHLYLEKTKVQLELYESIDQPSKEIKEKIASLRQILDVRTAVQREREQTGLTQKGAMRDMRAMGDRSTVDILDAMERIVGQIEAFSRNLTGMNEDVAKAQPQLFASEELGRIQNDMESVVRHLETQFKKLNQNYKKAQLTLADRKKRFIQVKKDYDRNIEILRGWGKQAYTNELKEAESNLKSAKNEAKNLDKLVKQAKIRLEMHKKELDRLYAPTKGEVSGSIADTLRQIVGLKKEFKKYAADVTRFDFSKATQQKVYELQARIEKIV